MTIHLDISNGELKMLRDVVLRAHQMTGGNHVRRDQIGSIVKRLHREGTIENIGTGAREQVEAGDSITRTWPQPTRPEAADI